MSHGSKRVQHMKRFFVGYICLLSFSCQYNKITSNKCYVLCSGRVMQEKSNWTFNSTCTLFQLDPKQFLRGILKDNLMIAAQAIYRKLLNTYNDIKEENRKTTEVPNSNDSPNYMPWTYKERTCKGSHWYQYFRPCITEEGFKCHQQPQKQPHRQKKETGWSSSRTRIWVFQVKVPRWGLPWHRRCREEGWFHRSG